jgi:hypothetical protein
MTPRASRRAWNSLRWLMSSSAATSDTVARSAATRTPSVPPEDRNVWKTVVHTQQATAHPRRGAVLRP